MSRQYIGNLGKIENGIVAVTAYELIEGMTVILAFEIYKPKQRMKQGDVDRSKPEIAAQMIKDLRARGLEFSLVLADSLYGESESNFLNCLEELKLDYVVAIRSSYHFSIKRKNAVFPDLYKLFRCRFVIATK